MTDSARIPGWTSDVLVSMADAAAVLGVGRSTMANRRDRGSVAGGRFPSPAAGEGRTELYRLSEILEFTVASGDQLPELRLAEYLERVISQRALADDPGRRISRADLARAIGHAAGAGSSGPALGNVLPPRRGGEKVPGSDLIATAVEDEGPIAVLDAVLDPSDRRGGANATFSTAALTDLAVAIASALLGQQARPTVYDPCVGEGRLLAAAANAVYAWRAIGHDVDADALDIAAVRLGLSLSRKTFIDLGDGPTGLVRDVFSEPLSDGPVDLIVAETPGRDDPWRWIDYTLDHLDRQGWAVLVTPDQILADERTARRVRAVESDRLRAIVRLPTAFRGHPRSATPTVVVIGPPRPAEELSVVDLGPSELDSEDVGAIQRLAADTVEFVDAQDQPAERLVRRERLLRAANVWTELRKKPTSAYVETGELLQAAIEKLGQYMAVQNDSDPSRVEAADQAWISALADVESSIAQIVKRRPRTIGGTTTSSKLRQLS